MSNVGADRRAQPALSIRLLGDVQLLARGVDVTAAVRYRKGLALLGYLATQHDRQHSREHLADLLWPDLDMAAARTNLRQVLIRLAQALNSDTAAPVLVATKHSIGLFPGTDTEIDVDVIASLANAGTGTAPARHELERRVELIRGEFLAGLSLPDCEEFEDWLQAARRNFHLRAAAFLERSCAEHEAAGRLPLAIRAAERLTSLDVWHEPHLRLLMRLLARSGQPRAALAVFDTLAENLRRQLDVEPDSRTRALRAEILAESLLGPAVPGGSAGEVANGSEQRWITVLCCEVRSRHENPEKAAEQCGELLTQVIECLREGGGCPAAPMGRRLVAYFGSPHTHEDAARRAALAALRIQRLAPPTASIRLAIHAGMALIQTVAGVPQLIGEVAETAMRLRLIVDEGEIAIGESALRPIEAQCRTDPLGVRRLRGATAPLAVYRLVDVGEAPPVAPRSISTPLSGRDAELTTLITLWHSAEAGHAQIALLIGEPGIGKTRLLDELALHVAAAGGRVHKIAARQESAARPLAPLARWLERAAGLGANDEPARREQCLRRYLDDLFDGHCSNVVATALFALVGGRERGPDPGPDEDVRQLWSNALVELFERLRAQRVALICCEDAQWADTSTLDLLPRLCADSAMIAVTVRPEGIPPGLPPGTVPLVLRPLDDAAGGAIVRACAGGAEPPAALLRELLDLGGGNPLALEEFTKAAQRPNAPSPMPGSLFDLLQGQLDRIGILKPLLQTAAVFGRYFHERPLARLLEAGDLSTDLEHACRSGLIVACGDGEYRFRHALIHHVAYLTSPRSRRRMLHAKIRALMAENPTTPLEEQARHLENAGEYAAAADHWHAAAQLAFKHRFAAEAIAHFERTLKLHLLGDSPTGVLHAVRQQLAEAHRLAQAQAARQAGAPRGPVAVTKRHAVHESSAAPLDAGSA